MNLPTSLRRFCFAHNHAVMLPAEALSQHGIDAAVKALLVQTEHALTTAQVACLEKGFALYWERCANLFKRAPRSWFPPRQNNVLIVLDDQRAIENAALSTHWVAPYTEAFAGASLLLYQSDLNTHPEFVAYALIHTERMSLLRQVPATVAFNLSYWFERDESDRAAFTQAAKQAKRPDATGFVQLSTAFEWVDSLLHDPLRAPDVEPNEPFAPVTGADLYVPTRLQPALMALCQQVEQSVQQALQAPRRPTQGNAAAVQQLMQWLATAQPHVIVINKEQQTLWSPQHHELSAINVWLSSAGADRIAAIQADLALIDQRTRSFFNAVEDPNALPRHCSVLERGDGVYVDAAKQAVVYEIDHPGFDPNAGPVPPFHRLLLGARVIHEWGHVAHTAKYLRVPEQRKDEYKAARKALGECFAKVLEHAPLRLKPEIDAELEQIEPRWRERPAALAKKTLSRVGDYLSNLMASHLLPSEEMQAYVRTNVRHHFDEQLGIVSALARYAYEVQYLSLAGIDRAYFFRTTRFYDYFIDSGIVSETAINQLFDSVAVVLACYEVDKERLRLPADSATSSHA